MLLNHSYAQHRAVFEKYLAQGLVKVWFGKGKQVGAVFEQSSQKAWDKGLVSQSRYIEEYILRNNL